jgi:hypothetical protein
MITRRRFPGRRKERPSPARDPKPEPADPSVLRDSAGAAWAASASASELTASEAA